MVNGVGAGLTADTTSGVVQVRGGNALGVGRWGVVYEVNYSFNREGEWVKLLQPYVVLDKAKPMSDIALDSFNRRPRYTLSFSYQL